MAWLANVKQITERIVGYFEFLAESPPLIAAAEANRAVEAAQSSFFWHQFCR